MPECFLGLLSPFAGQNEEVCAWLEIRDGERMRTYNPSPSVEDNDGAVCLSLS